MTTMPTPSASSATFRPTGSKVARFRAGSENMRSSHGMTGTAPTGIWARSPATRRRTLTVPLDFLDKGARYEATIYADGPGADWRTAPEKLAIRQQVVTAGDQLSLDLASGGGQAIRFRRL
ncbi:glycoside hydrolase family 97 C-terminal domain-containing protein [Sphingomonas sp. SORGH_AS_0879]|uniref:glycoside hydrolase family 97 C-terminal domain-containing protein n=1 Tax=Sphingomonas sp. SORGH_AS_0879 TaxID=3041790 RepID=UPI0027D8D96F|nr:glycoside hydrolase family 97 C-terminal domain-containing protein [Sphingomonas sp. SORGH_AS_0879]